MSNQLGEGLKAAIIGGAGPAAYFAAGGYWDMPLESRPGAAYKYVNANFQLAAYVIEKVGGPCRWLCTAGAGACRTCHMTFAYMLVAVYKRG